MGQALGEIAGQALAMIIFGGAIYALTVVAEKVRDRG